MLSFKPTVQHFANFNLWVQTGIRSFKKYLGRVLLNFAYLRKRYKKKTNTWIEKSICYHTPEFAFGDSIKELENKGNVESCRQLKSVDWALLNRRHLKPPKTTTAKP